MTYSDDAYEHGDTWNWQQNITYSFSDGDSSESSSASSSSGSSGSAGSSGSSATSAASSSTTSGVVYVNGTTTNTTGSATTVSASLTTGTSTSSSNTTTYSHSNNWTHTSDWIDWNTYKANGVNFGNWLELEEDYDQTWWAEYGGNSTDEWELCQYLGDQCGPVLEAHYESWVTTDDIDALAAVGVNILRIPTTYAAWVDVPGSALYHGNQQYWLKQLCVYAIETYQMQIIVGLHSLPGGVNSLNIGEHYGNDGWFYNATNLAYSWKATQAVLNFFVDTGYVQFFTIAPINEASDNFAGFATSAGLTENGTNWINTYIDGVLGQIAGIDTRIPLMLQDCFLGETYWSPFYAEGTNIVIDTHIYYFAASGIYAQWVEPAICGQAEYAAGDGKFPVFVGEYSLQTLYSNTLAGRQSIFETERYAWANWMAGGAFWNVRMINSDGVDGEGTLPEYWSYIDLIEEGVIVENTTMAYC